LNNLIEKGQEDGSAHNSNDRPSDPRILAAPGSHLVNNVRLGLVGSLEPVHFQQAAWGESEFGFIIFFHFDPAVFS